LTTCQGDAIAVPATTKLIPTAMMHLHVLKATVRHSGKDPRATLVSDPAGHQAVDGVTRAAVISSHFHPAAHGRSRGHHHWLEDATLPLVTRTRAPGLIVVVVSTVRRCWARTMPAHPRLVSTELSLRH
jgi:hypothetical protein